MPANTLVHDQRCLSVLMVACMCGQASVAELLVEHHAAMNTVWRPDGSAALLLAIGISSRPGACCKHAS